MTKFKKIDAFIDENFSYDYIYKIDDIFNKFSKYYNQNITNFKFIGYDKNMVVNILNDMYENKKINGIKHNNDILLNKIGIWKLFLEICNKIKLKDTKVKISKEKYENLVRKNIDSITKILNNNMKQDKILLDEGILLNIISEIFSKELDYTLNVGSNCIQNVLNEYCSKYDANKKKFIVNKKNIYNIIIRLYNNIEVWKDKYYTIDDIIMRLNYPDDLRNYYIPYFYNYNQLSKKYIQKIIKLDYNSENEFQKMDNWKIYGSDEEFKDSSGKYTIPVKRSSEIRPDGYNINRGKLQYLMNSAYCKWLIIELKHRMLNEKYDFSLNELECKINNSSPEDIINYSKDILNKLNSDYKKNLVKIINDNKEKLSQYKDLITTIEELKIFFNISIKIKDTIEYKELENYTNKLEKKKNNINSDNILNNIKNSLNNSSGKYYKKIAKKLYNKQIKYENNINNIKGKSYELQGQCKNKENIISKYIIYKLSNIGDIKALQFFKHSID